MGINSNCGFRTGFFWGGTDCQSVVESCALYMSWSFPSPTSSSCSLHFFPALNLMYDLKLLTAFLFSFLLTYCSFANWCLAVFLFASFSTDQLRCANGCGSCQCNRKIGQKQAGKCRHLRFTGENYSLAARKVH